MSDEYVKCKNCDNDAVIEDPKDQFYCDCLLYTSPSPRDS